MTTASSASRRRDSTDWRDHQDSDETPQCDACTHRARWSVCNLEGRDPLGRDQWIVRGVACGRHLHRVLDALEWEMDAVMLYDLAAFPEGGAG